MHPHVRLGLPALALFSFLLGTQPAGQGALPSDKSLEPLAASLGAYLEAREALTGLDEAQVTLEAALEALARQEQRTDVLADHALLGRALWLARDRAVRGLRTGKVTEDVFEGGRFADGLEYAYRLPKEIDEDGPGLPLILALPGADEEPASHLRAHWTNRDLLSGAILVSPAMPEERAEWDQVTVAGRPGGLCHLLTALRLACRRFPVDFDRVYVVGRGKSVPAAIAAGNYAPQLFAGVAGLAGDAGEQGPENFTNLPTLFLGGGALATAFVEGATRAGWDNSTLVPGGTQDKLWSWMLAHPRETYPDRVSIVVGQPFPTRAHWLRVAPSAPDARATAGLARDRNAILLSTHGVSQVTLHLNDALVDLSRPVLVVRDGVEKEIRVRRSLPVMLERLYDGTSDPGALYVADLVIDTAEPLPGSAPEPGIPPALLTRIEASAGSASELWSLYGELTEGDQAASARAAERVLRRLVRLEPDHAEARAALGQAGEPGLWFATPGAYERYLASQNAELASAVGRLLHRGHWIHPDERSFVNKGAAKDWTQGEWLSRSDQKRLAEGWVRQDFDWVAPEDVEQIDAGLWQVAGEWVPLAEANRLHANLDAMWHLPGPEVVVHSTAKRAIALRAMEEMGRAVKDLRRVFGVEPQLPLEVTVLRDEEEYDRLAFGDPDGRRLPTDSSGMYIVHSAFFADRWFQAREGKPEFTGMGVCYWDELAPHGDLYGVHSARLAFGLSYAEAIDPSPKTVKKARKRGPEKGYSAAFQSEKRLPGWLRTGGAVYAERYFRDEHVAADGDPWWARKWSLGNLQERGGLRPLDEVFEFQLDPGDREDGKKRLLEVGLVVAFIVDGECAPVVAAHAELKRGLLFGKPQRADAEALEEAVHANEAALRAFAGL